MTYFKKSKRKDGNIHWNYNTFGKKLQEYADNALIVEDFETEWKSVVGKYELDENST